MAVQLEWGSIAVAVIVGGLSVFGGIAIAVPKLEAIITIKFEEQTKQLERQERQIDKLQAVWEEHQRVSQGLSERLITHEAEDRARERARR